MRALAKACFILLFVSRALADSGTGYFWHVSDFHLDDSYDSTGDSCDFPVPRPGPYGNGSCDAPLRLVQDALSNMAAIRADVDFVLWSGDNAGHIPLKEFSQERNLRLIEAVTSAISRSFPDTVVVPSFGNHEFFPADYTDGTEHDFYDTVCKLWARWIVDADEIEQCRKGGFYSRLVSPNLRVVVANTILYLVENPKTKNLTDPSQQFEWLEQTLSTAKQSGEKVIVTAHVPPTIPAPNVFNWFYPQYQGRYVDLMKKFSDIIVAHHHGHEHRDVFKVLQNNDGSSATPVFLAPSVTPLRGGYNGKQGPRHNPGVRLVKYNPQTGKHLDYIQFYTNITEGNAQGKTKWEKLYSFQEAFKVPDMSVSSLREIFGRMAQPWSPTMMQYCNHFLVTGTPDVICNIQQQGTFWCAATSTNVNETTKCVQKYIHQYKYSVIH